MWVKARAISKLAHRALQNPLGAPIISTYATKPMNYETFYNNFVSSYCEDANLRVGQLFMNELYKYNPELYKSVPADLDCFYNDKLFGACSDWVSERWQDT